SRMMPMIGMKKASTTTTINCFGVLIGDEWAWSKPSSFMDAQPLAECRKELFFESRAVVDRRTSAERNPRIIATRPRPTKTRPGRFALQSRGTPRRAPVAQLDRVLVPEAKGHRFESCRARHPPTRAGGCCFLNPRHFQPSRRTP